MENKCIIILGDINIVPEYQNKGIGTKILNEYFVYGKNENKNIYLEVFFLRFYII